jgi:hypothetical protein
MRAQLFALGLLQFRSTLLSISQAPRALEVWQDGPDFLMSLNEHLVELTAKSLIACRECRAICDVSTNDSNVKLICPGCYKTLGDWTTISESATDITAFIENDGTSH